MSRAAISVNNLTKRFGAIQALGGVSLTVGRGTVLGLLGPNGAGKTTLVRILTTLITLDSGSASVAGHDVMTDPDAVRRTIGLAGQSAAVDPTLSGRENLELVGRLYHLPRDRYRARAEELLQQFQLTDAADRAAKTYSGGMRRRLDLAASLVNTPSVLFLDEPTTGLDPQSRNDLWEVIRTLVSQGTTVLLTTQYMEEAEALADRIVVIDHGWVIAEGTPTELKRQVGGDIIAMHLKRRGDTATALTAVKPFAHGEPTVDEAAGLVSIPVAGGADELVAVIRVLDAQQIPLADIVLRRPSLDEVFLTLTGKPAEPGGKP